MSEELKNKRLADLTACIERRDWQAARPALQHMHPADIAEVIRLSPTDLHDDIFFLLDESLKPDVLAELEKSVSEDVLDSLTSAEISTIVEEMSPDDAADVLSYLSDERSREVLDLMEDEESEEVKELLQYEEDTAGGIMTTDVVAFNQNLTVAEAIEKLTTVDQEEPFYYIYIVDEDMTFLGFVGLWEMLKIKDRQRRLGELFDKEYIAVKVDMDQEECARIMSKYDISSLPVLNDNNKLIGRIMVDDVIDVLEEEASEDIFRLAGSDDEDMSYSSPLQAVRFRLPWLLITLVTGFVSSLLFKQFIRNLPELIILSFFVPIVMAMGGNTGIQSSTLIIRGIAVGSLRGRSVVKLLTRECTAGAIMGAICAVIIGGWTRIVVMLSPDIVQHEPFFLASIVGIALFCAMAFASLFGALVPMVLNRVDIDPAVASGPFVTASNDIIALLIYYMVTVGMLHLYA